MAASNVLITGADKGIGLAVWIGARDPDIETGAVVTTLERLCST